MAKLGSIEIPAKNDIKQGEEVSLEDIILIEDLFRDFDLFKELFKETTRAKELWANRTKIKVNLNSLSAGTLASFETTPDTHRVEYQHSKTNLIYLLHSEDLKRKFKVPNEIRKSETLEAVIEETG